MPSTKPAICAAISTEIAERLGSTLEDVEEVLRVAAGLRSGRRGARDLAECLALQLSAKDRLDPAMQALLTRLDLVGAARHRRALHRLAASITKTSPT